jgi:hypothetical protein
MIATGWKPYVYYNKKTPLKINFKNIQIIFLKQNKNKKINKKIGY